MNGHGTSPLIDPRLRDRRIEVARGQGRRRLRIALGVAIVVVVALVGVGLTQSPVLDVDQVQVQGATASDADDVRTVAGIGTASPMVSVDTSGAADRVEALAWVDSATVTRSWPGTVVIEVVERTPVAIVGSGSQAVLVDAQGRVLGPAGEVEGLVHVSGSTADPGEQLDDERAGLLAVVDELPADLRREVAAATVDDQEITFVLTDEIEVQWGTGAQSSAKADALAVLLDQADRDTIDTINVSVPRATTLTRKTGEA